MKRFFIALSILSLCQIAGAADVNSPDPNLYLQKIKKLEQTVKVQQQRIDQLTAALADAKEEIEQLHAETTKTKERNAKLQEQARGTTVSVPFTGEETPLTVVGAYPKEYIGKTFIAIGGISVHGYYGFKYENTRETHVSLWFDELRQDMSRTDKSMDLYVKRGISRGLIEEISKSLDTDYQSKLIRIKATIPEERYSPDCPELQAELINWQFLSSDKKSWQDWAISEGATKPDSDKEKSQTSP